MLGFKKTKIKLGREKVSFSMEVTAFPGRMQEFLVNQAAERLIISPNARGVGKKSL